MATKTKFTKKAYARGENGSSQACTLTSNLEIVVGRFSTDLRRVMLPLSGSMKKYVAPFGVPVRLYLISPLGGKGCEEDSS